MSIHHLRVLLPLVLLAALSSYGCADDDTTSVLSNGVGPSPLSSTSAFVSRAVQVEPAFIEPVRIPGASCPNEQPFLAPIRTLPPRMSPMVCSWRRSASSSRARDGRTWR